MTYNHAAILKDKFFVKSEALVGIWKDKPKETSNINKCSNATCKQHSMSHKPQHTKS